MITLTAVTTSLSSSAINVLTKISSTIPAMMIANTRMPIRIADTLISWHTASAESHLYAKIPDTPYKISKA